MYLHTFFQYVQSCGPAAWPNTTIDPRYGWLKLYLGIDEPNCSYRNWFSLMWIESGGQFDTSKNNTHTYTHPNSHASAFLFQIPLTPFHPKTTPPEYPTLPSTQKGRRPTTLMKCWRRQVRSATLTLNSEGRWSLSGRFIQTVWHLGAQLLGQLRSDSAM